MNYSKIIACDTNNGSNFRVTLFVSGCNLKCSEKCHNKLAQDFNYGNKFTKETEDKIIELMSMPYIKGFSLLGGEPVDNICDDLINLLKRIKEIYPSKTIFCWSGYEFNQILNKNRGLEFLSYIDMLRDGRFIPELKNLNQYLQGSSNQKYTDVKKSLEKGEYVEYKFKEV